MIQDEPLDYYASLLIQKDDFVNIEQEPSLQDFNDQYTGHTGLDLRDDAYAVMNDFQKSLEELNEKTRITCNWQLAHHSLASASERKASASIMRQLLSANDTLSWERCYYYYSIIQRLFDSMVWNSQHASFMPDSPDVHELIIIEHVAIIALEASLQAIKLCDTFDQTWDAAGDILILLMICLSEDQGTASISQSVCKKWRETAMKRLLITLQKLTNDHNLKQQLDDHAASLPNAVVLDQSFMESLVDIKRGLPFILYLYRSNLNHVVFKYIYAVARESYSGARIVGNFDWCNQKIIDSINRLQDTIELSWQKRYEGVLECSYEVDEFVNNSNLLVNAVTLRDGIQLLTRWLVKELETESTWLNDCRRKARLQVLCMAVQLLRLWDPLLELWHENPDVICRLINLVSRTWALEVSVTAVNSGTPVPQSRGKQVDKDQLCDASLLIELLAALAPTLSCKRRMPRKVQKDLASLTGVEKLLDDILDQIICCSLRYDTHGLPLFLERPHDDMTREGLVRRRRAAQSYFASTDGSNENTYQYEESYRVYEGYAMPNQVLSQLIHAEICLIDDANYYCKILSYIRDTNYFNTVVCQLYAELLDHVRATRKYQMDWWNRLANQSPSTKDQSSELLLSIDSINRVSNLIGTLQLAFDAFSHYTSAACVFGDKILSYLTEMQRLILETNYLRNQKPEHADLDLLRKRIVSLSKTTVSLFGDKWLPIFVEQSSTRPDVSTYLRLACLICLACDWIEENVILVNSTPRTNDENLIDSLTLSNSTSSSLLQATIDDADDTSQMSQTSLQDFIDLQYDDEYRVTDGSSNLITCELPPELYSFVKNAFWDDRMAGY